MPHASSDSARGRADLAACEAILAKGSRSFHAASRLLPARVRRRAVALYAFCREADDAVDRDFGPGTLERLAARLDAAYAGRPEETPVDRAFAAAVAAARIPREVPDALIEGFAWDAEGRRYAGACDLEAYAMRVAGSVGLMMALAMDVRAPEPLARALDLGVAMQLTNIARDVGEDARMGRIYLPLDWCAEEGLDAGAFLARPEFSPAVGRVTARVLAAADRLYARADAGVASLPADCRPAIAAARSIYAAIGREVARADFDSVSRRAVVGPTAKAFTLAASLAAAAPQLRTGAAAPPLACGRTLLDSVARGGEPAAEPRPPSFADRVGGVAEAFVRLQQSRPAGRAALAEARR